MNDVDLIESVFGINSKKLRKGLAKIQRNKLRWAAFKQFNPRTRLDAVTLFLNKRYISWDKKSIVRSRLTPMVQGITPKPSDVRVFINREEFKQWQRLMLQGKYDIKSHVPRTNDEWMGIEIECFLPVDNFGGGEDWDTDIECNGDCFPEDTFESDFQEYVNNNYSATDILEMTSHARDRIRNDYRDGYEWDCDCSGNRNTDSPKEVLKQKLKELKVTYVDVVGDGSIDEDDGYFAVEVKVMTRLSDMSNLEKVCKFLNDNGAKVNKTCGLHVHMDVRQFDSATHSLMLARYGNSLKLLAAMVPKSRRENDRYCKMGVCTTDRYHAINGTAINKFGTIEVRLHSGTVNFEKISQWCKLLSAIKHCDMLQSLRPRKLYRFLDILNLPQDTREYVTKRISKFMPEFLQDSDMTVTESDEEIESDIDAEEVA